MTTPRPRARNRYVPENHLGLPLRRLTSLVNRRFPSWDRHVAAAHVFEIVGAVDATYSREMPEVLAAVIGEFSPTGCRGARIGTNGLAPGPGLQPSLLALAEYLLENYTITDPAALEAAVRADTIRELQHPTSCATCGHASDCALHNEEDADVEPCSCGRYGAPSA